MRLRPSATLLLLSALTPLSGAARTTSPVAAATDRLAIVDRAIEHHGGDLYRASEIRLRMCSKSGCSALRARVDGGAFDLEASGPVSAGERRVRITNDRVEWWQNGEPMPVGADREQPLRDWVMARIYFCFLPFRLDDPAVHKQDLGVETWNGRPLHKVKVGFASGSSTSARDEYVYWFDPASGRLEQFAYSYATGGGGLRFRRAFNHRRIGGIGFFDQENLGVEGPDLSVDLITPGYVASEMRPVSTITLDEIAVEPIR